MSTVPGTHIGYKLYTTEAGEPKYVKVPNERPPVLVIFGQNKPILVPVKLTTKMIIEQQDESRNGLYFTKRYPAYETAISQWCILYETKKLTLMTDPIKYKQIWPNSIEPKQQTHIFETSIPLFQGGPMTLESMQITTSKAKYLTFSAHPDPKKLFQTRVSRGFNLLRQTSRDEQDTQDFAVDCRPLVSRNNEGKLEKIPNIEMVFVVYLKSIQIDLKNVIDREEYHRLDSLENVLLFKQEY
jgi:hypothetical protein